MVTKDEIFGIAGIQTLGFQHPAGNANLCLFSVFYLPYRVTETLSARVYLRRKPAGILKNQTLHSCMPNFSVKIGIQRLITWELSPKPDGTVAQKEVGFGLPFSDDVIWRLSFDTDFN